MFFYNVRSVLVQWRRQVLSVAIIAAATATFIVPVSAFRSFSELMHMSSERDNVVVLSRGGGELWPSMTRVPAQVRTELASLPGVARSAGGEALISPEFLYTAGVAQGGRSLRLTVRGVDSHVFAVHRVLEGAWSPGQVLLGSGVRAIMPSVRVGDTLDFLGRSWRVSGFFGPHSGQTQYDCEIWVPLRDLMAARGEQAYGPVTIKADSEASARSLIATINADRNRFPEVRALPESALVEDIYKVLNALGVVQTVLSLLLLAIAGFAVLNVQLSNVFRRRTDMALLRAFGASRFEVAAGFVLEGGMIAFAGALLGTLLGLFAENYPIETGVFSREGLMVVRLSIGAGTLLLATFAGTVLGVLASLLPAWYASRFTVREERRAA